MKAIGLALCTLSVVAGVICGRLDHEATRPRNDEPRPALEFASSSATSGDARVSASKTQRRVRNAREEAPTSPPGAVDSDTGSRQEPADPAPASAEKNKLRLRLEPRLKELAEQIGRQEFQAALQGAMALAEETGEEAPELCDQALILAAKARVFARIVAQLPPAKASGESTGASAEKRKLSEVSLANGNKISAIEVKEEADRYVIKLQGGGVFAPRKEDVLGVQELKEEVAVGPNWPDLERKIARIDDSILLYVEGVERSASLGFRSQGLLVLERLIARPDSDKVPLLFVPDADEDFLKDWRVVAGRRAPQRRREAAGVVTQAKPDRPDPVVEVPPTAVTPPPSNDNVAAALQKAAQFFGEAQALYQSAAGEEGRSADLEKARERIHVAIEIVQGLGDHPDARNLRVKLGQLFSDVVRASPLF